MNYPLEVFEFFFSAIFIFFITVAALLGWTLTFQFHKENIDLRKRLGKELPEDVSFNERFLRVRNRVLCKFARVYLLIRRYRTIRRVYAFNRKVYRFIQTTAFW